MPRRRTAPKNPKTAKAYDHKETEAILRPDVGIQAQFKKKKEPAKYRYDRSLDPQLSWDINADREHAETLIENVRSAKLIRDQGTLRSPSQVATTPSRSQFLMFYNSVTNMTHAAQRDFVS